MEDLNSIEEVDDIETTEEVIEKPEKLEIKKIDSKKIQFAHLHNHSFYSLLDGLSSPVKLVEAAVANGYSALALTDHGSCGGILSFQKACKDKGIKPILGNEFYITKDRFQKDKTSVYYHLILWAKNHQGIKNLMKLTSLSEMEGKYRYGRIDFDLLSKHHEGLICSSACFTKDQMVDAVDDFIPIQDVKSVVVSHVGNNAKILNRTTREYSGKIKKIKTRGPSFTTESTEDHKYFVVKSENQKKENSTLFDENFHKNGLLLKRKRNFIGQWTSNVEKGDWLLYPNPRNFHIEQINKIDASLFNLPNRMPILVSISKEGKKILKNKRKELQMPIKKCEWVKSQLYRIENGKENYFVNINRLKSHIEKLKIEWDEFYKNYCFEVNGEDINAKRKNIPNTIPVTKELCFLLGAYCAEGNSGQYYFSLTLNYKEDKFAKEIKSAIEKTFALPVKITKNKKGNKQTITCHSQSASSFISKHCGVGCINKKVPSIIYHMKQEFQHSFIKGLILGDGSFRKKRLRVNESVGFGVISSKLAHGLTKLLLLSNIVPMVTERPPKIDKNGVSHKRVYFVQISGKQAIPLINFIWNDSGKLVIGVEHYSSKNIPITVNGIEYYTSEVVDVEFLDVKNKNVYCLNVGNKHSFNIGLSSVHNCSGGELPVLLINGQNEEAENLITKYKDLFGEDYYLEVMRHKYNEASKDQEKKEQELSLKIYEIGKKMGVKVIATNDAHYASRNDAKYHDVLLSIQTLDTIKNPERFTFNSQEFYLKSHKEMLDLFSDMPETLTNTMEIVNKVEEDLLTKSADLLPEYIVPEGYKDEVSYLKALVKDGMIVKKLIDKPEYRERIKVEMELIIRCGFVRYFLILWDIVNFARRKSIPVGVGRGSGCGSLCLFLLDITRMDPIKYGLLFERFINPERISPPDVDMDFEYFRRDEVFEYVYQKYGRNHCCKIGTYNSLKTRAVIRSVSKALDLGKDWEHLQEEKRKNPNVKAVESKKSLDIADYLAKLVPKGVDMTIENALRKSEEFRNAMNRYPELLECCMHIEKTNSSAGVHPAGIVICKNDIWDHIPLKESKGQIASQLTGGEVEDLGLLKFDFLALKTLTVVDDTIKLIKARHNIEIDIDNLEPNDAKVFGLFNGIYGRKMDNRGIFQFESPKISQMVRNIRIDTFEDLIVCNALYRPGPLEANVPEMYADYKHGRKKIVASHPKMLEILKDTYSMMVYQEDFMKVSQVLASFTKGQSDTLRKVVGKKKPELIKKEHLDEKFVAGCIKNGIEESVAKEIFQQIEYFGGYGFNRSHSAAYSFLAYQTAYLKVYYPLEFMCSLLSSEINNSDKGEKLNSYLKEAYNMWLIVDHPDINKSKMKFSLEDEVTKDGKKRTIIRTPLTGSDGVGEVAALSIIENQPYRDLKDFVSKVNGSKVSIKVFQSLVDTGCFDESWNMKRAELLATYESAKNEVSKEKANKKKQNEYIEEHGDASFLWLGGGDSEIKL